MGKLVSQEKPNCPAGHDLLAGRTVIITAAAGTGVGFATAKRCVEEGARVVISDRHERRLGQAAEQLSQIAAVPVVGVPCDVTIQDDVDRLFQTAIAEIGHIDVLVNNAALGIMSSIVDMSDETWFKVVDVTLNGTFRCTRAALRHMIPRASGAVVNLASVVGWRGDANAAPYAAAKAGVMALTRSAAREAGPSGVRVNAVAPSIAMHESLSKAWDAATLEELLKQEIFGRGAELWEIANTIVWLASDYSSYLSGESISVSSQHP
jgi:3-oxoacyl-[acyl-carrier protein] reductase